MPRTLGIHNITRRAGAAGLLVTWILGCSGGGDTQPAAPVCAVTALVLTPTSPSIVAGSSVTLSPTVSQTNCANLLLTWTSSNVATATVTSDGAVTGVAAGQATITAATGGRSGTALVTVIPAIETVTLAPDTATIRLGATLQLTATLRDATGAALTGRALQLTTSNAAVATVSAAGLVTGVAAGVATINASAEGKAATSRVIVEGPVETLQVAPAAFSLEIGGFLNLSVALRDAAGRNLTGRTIAFSSANASIAAVSATGQVTGVFPGGPVTITATSEGKSASMLVTILPVVAAVTVNAIGAPGPMGIADTRSFAAVVRNSAGTQILYRPVSWSVSDTALASISTLGVLTPRRAGTVTVRATSDGVAGTLSQVVIVATSPKRIAWALIPPDASGQALQGSALNATGGAIRATRTGPGDNRIVLERMARLDGTYKDVAMVSLLEGGGSATRCHVNSSQNASNGEDLEVLTSCYTTDGSKVDAYVLVLVVGGGALAGRHSFLTTTSATTSHTPPATQSYSSVGATNTLTRNGAGNYTASVANPRVGGTPENYFFTTVGPDGSTCGSAGWTFGSHAVVECEDFVGGVDARFGLLMLEAGRPGGKYAFAWSTDAAPTLNTDFTPNAEYQRTSSGSPIVMQRTGTGKYRLTIPGLAPTGARFAHVQVTPYQAPRVFCAASTPLAAANGIDAIVTVSCASRYSHSPTNAAFNILIID